MIISYSVVFGIVNIIVFQLTRQIAIVEKSMKSVLGHCKNMLGFSYLAIPTRHEVSGELYPQGDKYFILYFIIILLKHSQ